jgi:hypothetical protein
MRHPSHTCQSLDGVMECEMSGGMSSGPTFRRGTNEVVGVCARASVGVKGDNYRYGPIIAPLIPWLLQP